LLLPQLLTTKIGILFWLCKFLAKYFH